MSGQMEKIREKNMLGSLPIGRQNACVCMCTQKYMCAYLYVYTYLYTYTYIVCLYILVYICTDIYTHSHSHDPQIYLKTRN